MTTAASTDRIAVLCLGNVGLPLTHAGYDVMVYDIHACIGAALRAGHDPNGGTTDEKVAAITARLTHNAADPAGHTAVIIAVPTPITDAKAPDFGPVRSACASIAPHLSDGALLVLERTAYSDVTEEVCGPALAAGSGLEVDPAIKLAHSPERANPGDAEHSMPIVIKSVADQDADTLTRVKAIYASVIKAGPHRASPIAMAEVAKLTENTQRSLNIALVNKFSLIFAHINLDTRLDLDTREVREKAGTKWNFLPFKSGLVGSHCIGVGPSYLTYRAEQLGDHPEIIRSGRRANDAMARHVAQILIKAVLKKVSGLRKAWVLILGHSFKENCADTRNTCVTEIISELGDTAVHAEVHDPWLGVDRLTAQHGVTAVERPQHGAYVTVSIAMNHRRRSSHPDEMPSAALANRARSYSTSKEYSAKQAVA